MVRSTHIEHNFSLHNPKGVNVLMRAGVVLRLLLLLRCFVLLLPLPQSLRIPHHF